MALTKPQRQLLKVVFNIVGPTAPTEVRNEMVVTDGHTVDDLKAITHEKMCEYIGSQETFLRAWEITLAKIHSELNPPIAEIKNVDGSPTIVEIVSTEKVTKKSKPTKENA